MSAPASLVLPGETRRLAALQRLAVRVEGSDPTLDAALELVATSFGAAAVSVTMVDADSASTLATTSREAPLAVPRSRSVAAAAIDADGPVSRTIRRYADLHDDPWSGRLGRPLTLVAVPLRARGGEAVGALELVWTRDRVPAADDHEALRGWAVHLSDVLELRAEVGEYRRFVELSPDALTVLDLDGVIVLANPALAALVGRAEPTELLGRTFLEFVARHDRARVTSGLARVLFSRDRTLQLDLDLVAADGRLVRCSASSANLGGPRRHVQLVVHDLSDRLRGEEERTRLSEQLARAQRLDAVGRIAGGLAHDLNNLLAVMVSNLGLAQESLASVAQTVPAAPLSDVDANLAELRVAVDRASELTGKLLSFARDEGSAGGSADIDEVTVTVRELIGRSLGPDIVLRVEVPDRLPRVAVDPVQLERVLTNLVINAREAVRDGGTITVRAARAALPAPDIVDAGEHGPSAVPLEVDDDGVGMDVTTQARAFEPLFTTRAGEGGTGLGLASVLSFVDEADGEVELASAPGEGTTVSLTLPVAEEAAADGLLANDVPVAGARIVLVDPGERTRRVISRMLRGAGYRVQAVGSAERALRALREDDTDLIVTELSLPGRSGARLLEDALDERPDLRAVALASTDGPTSLSGVPVLRKPFSHDRLLRTVERVLDGR